MNQHWCAFLVDAFRWNYYSFVAFRLDQNLDYSKVSLKTLEIHDIYVFYMTSFAEIVVILSVHPNEFQLESDLFRAVLLIASTLTAKFC